MAKSCVWLRLGLLPTYRRASWLRPDRPAVRPNPPHRPKGEGDFARDLLADPTFPHGGRLEHGERTMNAHQDRASRANASDLECCGLTKTNKTKELNHGLSSNTRPPKPPGSIGRPERAGRLDLAPSPNRSEQVGAKLRQWNDRAAHRNLTQTGSMPV
jgi:hypothetical protein